MIIEIQQKIAGLLRVQGLSRSAGQVRHPQAPGPVLSRITPYDAAGPIQAGITSDLQGLIHIRYEDITSGDLDTASSVFANDCENAIPYGAA